MARCFSTAEGPSLAEMTFQPSRRRLYEIASTSEGSSSTTRMSGSSAPASWRRIRHSCHVFVRLVLQPRCPRSIDAKNHMLSIVQSGDRQRVYLALVFSRSLSNRSISPSLRRSRLGLWYSLPCGRSCPVFHVRCCQV